MEFLYVVDFTPIQIHISNVIKFQSVFRLVNGFKIPGMEPVGMIRTPPHRCQTEIRPLSQ